MGYSCTGYRDCLAYRQPWVPFPTSRKQSKIRHRFAENSDTLPSLSVGSVASSSPSLDSVHCLSATAWLCSGNHQLFCMAQRDSIAAGHWHHLLCPLKSIGLFWEDPESCSPGTPAWGSRPSFFTSLCNIGQGQVLGHSEPWFLHL